MLPAHLIVMGGGYIGCELGQMFRRFGSAVTILGRQPHLLPREDEEVSRVLEEVFLDEGIDLRLDATVERIERGSRTGGGADVRVKLAGSDGVEGSHLLVATGRRPSTDELGCEAAGVALDERGHVVVDDLYRTSAEGVYAVGDVIQGPQFTHTSWDDHRRLLAVLEGRPTAGRSGAIVPSCVFTDPQVAAVGLSEREARRQGVAHQVATMPWGEVARAIETDRTSGILKVLVAPGFGADPGRPSGGRRGRRAHPRLPRAHAGEGLGPRAGRRPDGAPDAGRGPAVGAHEAARVVLSHRQDWVATLQARPGGQSASRRQGVWPATWSERSRELATISSTQPGGRSARSTV